MPLELHNTGAAMPKAIPRPPGGVQPGVASWFSFGLTGPAMACLLCFHHTKGKALDSVEIMPLRFHAITPKSVISGMSFIKSTDRK